MNNNEVCKPDWDGFRKGPLWGNWSRYNSGKYYPQWSAVYDFIWAVFFFFLAAVSFAGLVEFFREAPYGIFTGLFFLIGLMYMSMAASSYFLYTETLEAWQYVLRYTKIRTKDEFYVVYKNLEQRYQELESVAMSQDKRPFVELYKHYERLHLLSPR